MFKKKLLCLILFSLVSCSTKILDKSEDYIFQYRGAVTQDKAPDIQLFQMLRSDLDHVLYIVDSRPLDRGWSLKKIVESNSVPDLSKYFEKLGINRYYFQLIAANLVVVDGYFEEANLMEKMYNECPLFIRINKDFTGPYTFFNRCLQ